MKIYKHFSLLSFSIIRKLIHNELVKVIEFVYHMSDCNDNISLFDSRSDLTFARSVRAINFIHVELSCQMDNIYKMKIMSSGLSHNFFKAGQTRIPRYM